MTKICDTILVYLLPAILIYQCIEGRPRGYVRFSIFHRFYTYGNGDERHEEVGGGECCLRQAETTDSSADVITQIPIENIENAISEDGSANLPNLEEELGEAVGGNDTSASIETGSTDCVFPGDCPIQTTTVVVDAGTANTPSPPGTHTVPNNPVSGAIAAAGAGASGAASSIGEGATSAVSGGAAGGSGAADEAADAGAIATGGLPNLPIPG